MLEVRERIVKSNCEADQAEQLPGPKNGPGMTKKAATVNKLDVRERDVYMLDVRERAEQLCGAETVVDEIEPNTDADNMPRDETVVDGIEPNTDAGDYQGDEDSQADQGQSRPDETKPNCDVEKEKETEPNTSAGDIPRDEMDQAEHIPRAE